MGQGSSARREQASWSRGLRAAGRALRGGGQRRDSGKEGAREGAAAALPHSPRASHICTGSSLAARRRPAQCSILPPVSCSVSPALPVRLRHLARGPTHRQTALGTPRPAPPGRAMLIALPGPARGISAAPPAAPATSRDYEPESAALPGPPLSQPGHGLPPDRVRTARSP